MKEMDEITIPETTITPEQYEFNARQLIMSVIYRAVEDYCFFKNENKRKDILKNLRSSRMNELSDGMSLIVAEQLELHPEEIAKRLGKDEKTNQKEEL